MTWRRTWYLGTCLVVAVAAYIAIDFYTTSTEVQNSKTVRYSYALALTMVRKSFDIYGL